MGFIFPPIAFSCQKIFLTLYLVSQERKMKKLHDGVANSLQRWKQKSSRLSSQFRSDSYTLECTHMTNEMGERQIRRRRGNSNCEGRRSFSCEDNFLRHHVMWQLNNVLMTPPLSTLAQPQSYYARLCISPVGGRVDWARALNHVTTAAKDKK